MKNLLCFYIDTSDDAGTNKVVAEMLGQQWEERIAPGKKCADGFCRNLWNVSWQEVKNLISNYRSMKLKFTLYQERQGEIVQVCGVEIPVDTPEAREEFLKNSNVSMERFLEVCRRIKQRPEVRPGAAPLNTHKWPQKINPARARQTSFQRRLFHGHKV